MNCWCDTFAKREVSEGMYVPRCDPPAKQLLPRESVAVVIDGVKQTTDVAKAARFALAHNDAERCLHLPHVTLLAVARGTEGSVGQRRTPSAQLTGLHAMCASPPSHKCTQTMAIQADVALLCHSTDGAGALGLESRRKCPNCRWQELAQHRMLCPPDGDRTRLLELMADDLCRWMQTHHTHPELVYWLPRYIKLRGTHSLMDMP